MSEHRVIALGFFDGVHLGHAALLSRTASIAREYNLVPAVLSFDEHPMSRISGIKVPLLSSSEDRMMLIEKLFEIKESIVLRFDDITMHMPWEKFLDSLIEEYQVDYIVCGYDYSCGYKGEGTASRLEQRCKEHGIGCDIIDPISIDGIRVSSSAIREMVMDGRMETACSFYGHPHVMTGIVRTGKKLGRTIDAPTINLRFDGDIVIPRHGVYAARVTLPDGQKYVGVTNVGVRPTVENTDIVNAETYLIGYSGNLYGQKVQLDFYKFMRPEFKFNGLEELKKQIHMDADNVAAYFEGTKL